MDKIKRLKKIKEDIETSERVGDSLPEGIFWLIEELETAWALLRAVDTMEKNPDFVKTDAWFVNTPRQ